MTKYGEEDLDLLVEPNVRMPVQALRKRSPIFIILTTIARLVIPVMGLLGVFMLVQFAKAFPVTLFDRYPSDQAELNLSTWLTGGHCAVPLCFFVVHLTNRAFGAGLALAQVLIAWAVLVAAALYLTPQITELMPWWKWPSRETALVFAGALFAGQIAAIMVFDMTRGPVWWKAPLYAGMIGSAVYVGLYYSLAPLDPKIPFSLALTTDGTINFIMAVLLIVPYWILRPMIRPLPGYGGA